MPIRRLRWGRFVNAADAMAWIDCSGSFNRRAVYFNGAAVAAQSVGDREIVLDGGEVLELDAGAVLREGALGKTALAVGPLVIEVEPAEGGSRATVTENGEIFNPLFRLMARFVFGYTGSIETFLGDMGKRLGEKAG